MRLNAAPMSLAGSLLLLVTMAPACSPKPKHKLSTLFSTKSRSLKETGLAMSYQIVTANHGGRFWMRSRHASEYPNNPESDLLTGTEFEILLPLTSQPFPS